MNEEQLKYYFVQYWFCVNREILMIDELKNVLFEIYREVEKTIPLGIENRLQLINDNYKIRILKGKSS